MAFTARGTRRRRTLLPRRPKDGQNRATTPGYPGNVGSEWQPDRGPTMPPPKPQRTVAVSGDAGEGKPSSPFMEALNRYKELIAIIFFFIGGISWLYGYFATKEQMRVMKCLMNTNIEFIQYQLQQKLAFDERRQYDAEHLRLETSEKHSREDDLNLHDLEQRIDLAKKKAETAISKIAEAEHILQSNECEEQPSSPAPSKAK
jgi:hypothetical protein